MYRRKLILTRQGFMLGRYKQIHVVAGKANIQKPPKMTVQRVLPPITDLVSDETRGKLQVSKLVCIAGVCRGMASSSRSLNSSRRRLTAPCSTTPAFLKMNMTTHCPSTRKASSPVPCSTRLTETPRRAPSGHTSSAFGSSSTYLPVTNVTGLSLLQELAKRLRGSSPAGPRALPTPRPEVDRGQVVQKIATLGDKNGLPRVVMKETPAILTRSNPQLHDKLRLCQPATDAAHAVAWIYKLSLSRLPNNFPEEQSKSSLAETEYLHNLAVIAMFTKEQARSSHSFHLSHQGTNVPLPAGGARGAGQHATEGKLTSVIYFVPTTTLLEPGTGESAVIELDTFLFNRAVVEPSLVYQDLVEDSLADLELQYRGAIAARERYNKGFCALSFYPGPRECSKAPDLRPVETEHAFSARPGGGCCWRRKKRKLRSSKSSRPRPPSLPTCTQGRRLGGGGEGPGLRPRWRIWALPSTPTWARSTPSTRPKT